MTYFGTINGNSLILLRKYTNLIFELWVRNQKT
jgi:hypothetical protein